MAPHTDTETTALKSQMEHAQAQFQHADENARKAERAYANAVVHDHGLSVGTVIKWLDTRGHPYDVVSGWSYDRSVNRVCFNANRLTKSGQPSQANGAVESYVIDLDRPTTRWIVVGEITDPTPNEWTR